MPTTRTRAKEKSDELLQVLSGFDQVAIVMHDNPDPDAIAAGWGLHVLIEERLPRSVSLIAGGAIVRAENRHMVDLLMPPIELVDRLDLPADTGIVLVDCGLGTANHLVTRHSIRPVGVIDHHVNGKRTATVPFLDVRPDVAATVSIVAAYLREQGLEPGEKLATAMQYAIRTETRGYETNHADLDRAVVLWLTEWADPALLAEIESAPLSRQYYGDLAMALHNTQVVGNTALCLLPRAEGAETVGEVADLLVRCRGIQRVLSGALVHGDLVVSVRTERSRDSAARLVRKVLDGLGSGGGHTHRAGGKVPDVAGTSIGPEMKTEIRQRWLAACGVPDGDEMPLVPPLGRPA